MDGEVHHAPNIYSPGLLAGSANPYDRTILPVRCNRYGFRPGQKYVGREFRSSKYANWKILSYFPGRPGLKHENVAMQRPVMNPTYLDDAPAAKRPRRWGRWLKAVGRVVAMTCQLLLTNPFIVRDPGHLRVDVGTPVGRFVRGLLYRLAFVPAVAAVVAGLLVYAGTHPSIPLIEKDPITVGVYYDPITFASQEGNRLEGWLVPVVDAKKVVEQRDGVLRTKWPAVVLVHDHGQSREQMLPLVHPLHEAGYVVLVTGLRGDDGANNFGRTFGLNESHDVTAAVDLLRRRPFVDATRIAVVGVGTGAIAATLAAERDANLSAVISLRPPDGADALLHRYVVPKKLAWLGPLCEWSFEIAYGVDANELNSRTHDKHEGELVLRHVGAMDDMSLIERIVDHLYTENQNTKTTSVDAD